METLFSMALVLMIVKIKQRLVVAKNYAADVQMIQKTQHNAIYVNRNILIMKEIVKSLAILVYIDVIHKIYEINAYQIAHNAEQAIIVMFIILNLISVYPVMKNV